MQAFTIAKAIGQRNFCWRPCLCSGMLSVHEKTTCERARSMMDRF